MSDDQSGYQPGQTPPPGNQPPNWGNAYPPPSQYPPGYQPYYVPPKHPQATTAMIMGILGLAVCGVLAPIAWVMGGRALQEIDANPTAYSGRGEANAGKIMGIVGSCLIILMIVAFVGFIFLGLAVESSGGSL